MKKVKTKEGATSMKKVKKLKGWIAMNKGEFDLENISFFNKKYEALRCFEGQQEILPVEVTIDLSKLGSAFIPAGKERTKQ